LEIFAVLMQVTYKERRKMNDEHDIPALDFCREDAESHLLLARSRPLLPATPVGLIGAVRFR
jgi:hypothetical protein